LYQTFATYGAFFYVDVLLLPAAAVGVGMAAFGLWNAVNDLIVGYWSDRTRTRWGRRRPYILLGTVPLVASFALLWSPPAGLEGGRLFVWFLAWAFVFDLFYTVVVLNWAALFPEVTESLGERAGLSAVRQGFRIVGTIAAVAGTPLLYAGVGWPTMGLLFAAVSAVFLYFSAQGVVERPEFALGEPLPLRSAMRQTLADRAFVTLMVASVAVNFTYVALATTFPFYARYVLEATEQAVSLIMGAIFVVAFVLLQPWRRLAVRLGAWQATRLAIGVFAVSLVPLAFAKVVWHGLAAALALGCGLAGLMVALDILLADVIDADEVRTGLRREGMYYGVNGVLIRLGVTLQALFMGGILTLSGYEAALPPGLQPPAAVLGLRLMISGLPILALGAAALGLRAYPLHGRELARVQDELADLHAAKADLLREEERGR